MARRVVGPRPNLNGKICLGRKLGGRKNKNSFGPELGLGMGLCSGKAAAPGTGWGLWGRWGTGLSTAFGFGRPPGTAPGHDFALGSGSGSALQSDSDVASALDLDRRDHSYTISACEKGDFPGRLMY